MKKSSYIYGILLAGLVITGGTSCSKHFLDEELKSKYAPDNTLVDELGFEAASTGLQSIMRNDYGNIQSLLATFYVGTDMAITGQAAAIQVPYEDYRNLNPQTGSLSSIWNWNYKVINAANNIIAAAANPKASLTQQQRDFYKAEASFFRAYAYNQLSILFGGVPIIKEPVTVPRTDYTRAAEADVIQFMIDDLTFAEKNLPDPANVKKQGRINKFAASQLLAEALLRANKPADAEAAAKRVIDSKFFNLVTARYGVKAAQPGDPFADMFIYGNMRRSQGNTEAIWVIEQQYNVPGGGSTEFDQRRREWGPFYVNVAGMKVADSLGGRGIGRIRPTNWWTYELYEKTDMRNSPYNIRRTYYYNDPASPKYGQQVVVTGFDTIQNIYAHTTKWYEFQPQDIQGAQDYKDRIQMRLGETYLLLAEAQLLQGRLDDAAASINVIRGRAHATPVQAAQVTMDYILDERARELTAEELRRLTLVRTKKLVDRVRKYNPKTAPTISDFNIHLPIPQSEIDVNKDAVLTQNDGYQK
ncbi:RagB/SusD family nutrient uptake outer membrane protein [Chitinophaga qingshengii]|uniref:RagB/SusD family nutrient uptake outer membrane protein n=1 Tax=Chitinophaga qingshengii TaxID=1569794 RepID=A0ABR7THK7_9BACT|nr:RagB/SusD family nutrient uptake outer membrane protein [Chitinophaga qingshengii]MBC9929460.1 RagB/SusD family nutrient uptake outer membrane protein [Chitinophaga qingshengii]